MRLAIQNRTFLPTDAYIVEHRDGMRRVVTISKLTYSVSENGVVDLASKQRQIRIGDTPHSERPGASVRYPTDLAVEKPGTDVVLVGHGHAPPGPRTDFLVALDVRSGERRLTKALRISGPRVYTSGLGGGAKLGPPELVGPKTPLIYELAYGGSASSPGRRGVRESRNPVGRGVAVNPADLVGTPGPRIEDPAHPLDSGTPSPAGLAPIDLNWTPRVERQGTADENWRRTWCPLPPKDQDPRVACFAPEGLWSEQPLEADLQVVATGVTPGGSWEFRLPPARPRIEITVRGVTSQPATHLDTVLVDADAGKIELTWRATALAPKRAHDVEAVLVWFDVFPPEEMLARSVERSKARAPQ